MSSTCSLRPVRPFSAGPEPGSQRTLLSPHRTAGVWLAKEGQGWHLGEGGIPPPTSLPGCGERVQSGCQLHLRVALESLQEEGGGRKSPPLEPGFEPCCRGVRTNPPPAPGPSGAGRPSLPLRWEQGKLCGAPGAIKAHNPPALPLLSGATPPTLTFPPHLRHWTAQMQPSLGQVSRRSWAGLGGTLPGAVLSDPREQAQGAGPGNSLVPLPEPLTAVLTQRSRR